MLSSYDPVTKMFHCFVIVCGSTILLDRTVLTHFIPIYSYLTSEIPLGENLRKNVHYAKPRISQSIGEKSVMFVK